MLSDERDNERDHPLLYLGRIHRVVAEGVEVDVTLWHPKDRRRLVRLLELTQLPCAWHTRRAVELFLAAPRFPSVADKTIAGQKPLVCFVARLPAEIGRALELLVVRLRGHLGRSTKAQIARMALRDYLEAAVPLLKAGEIDPLAYATPYRR